MVWNRADEADLTYQHDVMYVKGCPEYNVYMIRSSRHQGHALHEKTTQSQAFRFVHPATVLSYKLGYVKVFSALLIQLFLIHQKDNVRKYIFSYQY